MLRLISLIFFSLVIFSLSAKAETDCFKVVQQVDVVDDVEDLHSCSDFFWHNGKYDKYSFNNVITLGKRILFFEPQNLETMTNVVWLLYSKWVTWKKNPEQMPDGESKVNEALDLAKKYELYNKKNADYFLQVALQLDPLFRVHRNDLKDFSIKYYIKVVNLISRSESEPQLQQRLRAELNLGHWFSFKNANLHEALKWYKEALKTEPNNKVALRRVKELNDGGVNELIRHCF